MTDFEFELPRQTPTQLRGRARALRDAGLGVLSIAVRMGIDWHTVADWLRVSHEPSAERGIEVHSFGSADTWR